MKHLKEFNSFLHEGENLNYDLRKSYVKGGYAVNDPKRFVGNREETVEAEIEIEGGNTETLFMIPLDLANEILFKSEYGVYSQDELDEIGVSLDSFPESFGDPNRLRVAVLDNDEFDEVVFQEDDLGKMDSSQGKPWGGSYTSSVPRTEITRGGKTFRLSSSRPKI